MIATVVEGVEFGQFVFDCGCLLEQSAVTTDNLLPINYIAIGVDHFTPVGSVRDATLAPQVEQEPESVERVL